MGINADYLLQAISFVSLIPELQHLRNMKLLFIGLAIIATVCAQTISNDYLPPTEEYAGAASHAVDSNTLEYEPDHTLADDGYRYKTVKRFRHRHRRDVSELTSSYLPPHGAASTQSYAVEAETAPAPVYAAPAAQQYETSYETAASEPAHELAADGYRYKTVKRYRLRHRRDVNELTSSYLPPHAASAPEPVYSAPAQTYAETAPAPVYAAPAAQQYEASYETAASEPAHELAADGYRYKTVKRYRLRHRRDVSELTNSYLPPHAASAPAPVYSAPVQTYAETAPAPVYAAPVAQQYEASYETAASEPAHELAADGYRYKTVKRYRLRHRRDVNELTSSYLPPHAASAPEPVYSAPAQTYAETAPAPVYAAPAAQQYEASYETAASEPAHELAADGYRYKTVKRYRLRHRRDVNELTSSYLPPHAASAPEPVYSAPAQTYAETAPAPVYAAPAAQQYETSYETAASEPAHELAADGYRYKTVKRYRLRHRRDVNELTSSYLPPHAASAPEPVYSAPAQTYAETAPAPVYAAPAAQQYETSYETAASEPAHELAADGYRYKTVKRYRLRHRRDVNELTNSYLPPHAASAPAPVYSAPATQSYAVEAESAPAQVYSAPAAQHYEASYETAASEPAHTLAADGYRYKTVKRYRYRYRH